MLSKINEEYSLMQEKYGDSSLDAIVGGGCIKDPELCLIFMNPTGRNVASSKDWIGPKHPWMGTKRVWDLLFKLGLIDEEINNEIKSIKGPSWDVAFATKVYDHVAVKGLYITNMAKCTQIDARPLKDDIFKNYLDLLDEEISIVNPKKIICFGNQVSSLFLNEKIKVSEVRCKKFLKKINSSFYETYAVYYPVGNGSFNIDKAISDMKIILEKK